MHKNKNISKRFKISFIFIGLTLLTIGGAKLSKYNTGLSEQQFYKVAQKVASLYEQEIKAKNKQLILRPLWNETDMAYAHDIVEYNQLEVTVTGDYARKPGMTADALALLFCHEFGHLFGGAPYRTFLASSSEGQSDYYSTLKCFKKYAKDDDNKKIVFRMGKKITHDIYKPCYTVYKNTPDLYVCLRGTVAAYQLIRAQNPNAKLSLTDKSTHITDFNLTMDHPDPQCRLDTLIAGLLCNVKGELSNDDYKKGTCVKGKGHPLGKRPLCMFNPNSNT